MVALMTLGNTGAARFAASYGNNMVLQQAPQRAVVWGWTTPEQAAVTLTVKSPASSKDYKGTVQRVNASVCTWRVVLDAHAASSSGGAAVPYTLTFSAAGTVIRCVCFRLLLASSQCAHALLTNMPWI